MYPRRRVVKIIIILAINFIFSVLYFGPPIFVFILDVLLTVPLFLLDEIQAHLLFDPGDVGKGFTSVDVISILNSKEEYEQALLTAYNPPNQFAYIHMGQPFCHPNVQMLILVKSAFANMALRQAIRVSWGQQDNSKYHLKFLLGRSAKLQRLIDSESAKYGDIIQKDFTDAYMNNTYKTIMAFDWSVRHCGHAQFTLFVDDDYYIDKYAILDYASSFSLKSSESLFIGTPLYGRPVRYPGNKWYVTRSTYPYARYPSYLAGGAYIVSKTVARKFLFAFPFIRYYWIDDVWLGIVATVIGIQPMGDHRFSDEVFDLDNINPRFVSHRGNHDPSEIVDIWERNENMIGP